MPSPPGEGTTAEIYTQMAAIEQPVFSAIDSDFHAYAFFPPVDPASDLPYPFSFRWEPRWIVEDRHMGSGTDKPWRWLTYVVILVGRATQDLSALTEEAEQYVIPFYGLYLNNRTINGTVRNIRFGGPQGQPGEAGVMGPLMYENVRHFGAQFPIILEQTRHF